jgi:hypothetical protein
MVAVGCDVLVLVVVAAAADTAISPISFASLLESEFYSRFQSARLLPLPVLIPGVSAAASFILAALHFFERATTQPKTTPNRLRRRNEHVAMIISWRNFGSIFLCTPCPFSIFFKFF